MKAAGTNIEFSHTETTTAASKDVWAVWTDVGNWGLWDTGLKGAEGAVDRLGAQGTIIDASGRRSPFTVVEYSKGVSYAFRTKLPGGALVVRRVIEAENPTRFSHYVSFEGVGGALMSFVLGPKFRRALPVTMQLLTARAEEVEQ